LWAILASIVSENYTTQFDVHKTFIPYVDGTMPEVS
jgi:hypothetical protein